jgi:hypothetical protein
LGWLGNWGVGGKDVEEDFLVDGDLFEELSGDLLDLEGGVGVEL